MKNLKIIISVLHLFICTYLSAQDRITVSTSSTNIFIETYDFRSWSNDHKLNNAYRLGPGSSKILKAGIKTAFKWIELNNKHLKNFEKEICRFKVMEKELFKFHGYVDEFSVEMSVLYKGSSDGSFTIEIKPYNSSFVFIELNEFDTLKSFDDLLNGKSANKEIDDIFKN